MEKSSQSPATTQETQARELPAELCAFLAANSAYREFRMSREEYLEAKRAFQEWEDRTGYYALDYQRTYFGARKAA